jgi:hypothetical protein
MERHQLQDHSAAGKRPCPHAPHKHAHTGADRIQPSEAQIEAPTAGSVAWALGDVVEGRGRPRKERKEGRVKRGKEARLGQLSERGEECGRPLSHLGDDVRAFLRRPGHVSDL